MGHAHRRQRETPQQPVECVPRRFVLSSGVSLIRYSDCDASDVVPSGGLMIRRPASLHAVLRCAGVPALRRYYQGAATSRRPSRRASFSFAWRYRRCVRCFAPVGVTNAPPRAWACWGSASPLPKFSTETTGSPKFLGNPNCTFAGLFDPGSSTASNHHNAAARPPWRERQGLLHCGFRGSIPRLWCSLSTLHPGGRPPRMQDSLPAAGQALPDGL